MFISRETNGSLSCIRLSQEDDLNLKKYSKDRVYNIIAFWCSLIYEINYCDFQMSRLVKFTYCFVKIRKRIELRDKLE